MSNRYKNIQWQCILINCVCYFQIYQKSHNIIDTYFSEPQDDEPLPDEFQFVTGQSNENIQF